MGERKYKEYIYYNEQVANLFIKEKKENTTLPSKYYLENIFTRLGETENELEKNAYEWSTEEVMDYYRERNFRSPQRLLVENSVLSQYFEFAKKNHHTLNLQNPFEPITRDIAIKLINNTANKDTIFSKEDIDKILANIENEYMKFVILGIFEGVYGAEGCEILNVKISDVYPEGYIKTITGRKVKISKRLYRYAIAAYEEETYTNRGGRECRLFDTPEGYVVKKKRRNIDVEDNHKKYLRIVKDSKEIGQKINNPYFNFQNVYMSGIINFLRENYQKEKEIDPDLEVEHYLYNKGIALLEEQWGYKVPKRYFYTRYGAWLK